MIASLFVIPWPGSLSNAYSNIQWRPNSGALLFTADDGPVLDELAFGSTDLFTVTVDGQLTRLTNDGYQYAGAKFSPNGRWISYSRSMGNDMIIKPPRRNDGGPEDLYVRPVAGGQPLNLTANFDLESRRRNVVAGQPLHILHDGDRRRESSLLDQFGSKWPISGHRILIASRPDGVMARRNRSLSKSEGVA